MPRTARATPGGFSFHALNRGNRRADEFHAEGDYDGFVRLLGQAVARFPVRLLGFCLMPNHFHLAAWPPGDDDLSAFMHWLLTTHASRYQKYYRSTGHVWQGRFKAFPIQEDDHLLTVLRGLPGWSTHSTAWSAGRASALGEEEIPQGDSGEKAADNSRRGTMCARIMSGRVATLLGDVSEESSP